MPDGGNQAGTTRLIFSKEDAMAEHQNGMKNQGQTTLQGQKNPDEERRRQKQPGQDLNVDEAGGPLPEQTNQNKPSEQR